MSLEKLEELVRPSGFFRVKARRLTALCEFLDERYTDSIVRMGERPTKELRAELLDVYGIGEETADDILLYALNRPVFVVDAFTRRIFHRLGWCRQTPATVKSSGCSMTNYRETPLSSTSITR